MNLVDVHCHLNHELFKDDLDAVLQRARQEGVKRILLSGVNPVANKEVLEFVKKDPALLKASLGIYPIDALGLQLDAVGLPHHPGPIDLDKEFTFFEKNRQKITAIGEVGMDFHWASREETYEQQAENFRRIIRFALKIQKPLVIHSRKAEEECIQILSEEIKNREIPVINHCFSGGKAVISKAAALGHYFSIPPNIVKASNFQTLVKLVDLNQLLTETDSPWLSPIKGQKNEPAFVLKSVEKIAEIKGLTREEVARQIWQNYEKVFG
ncbi:TatD family hydrolase [Candidatus Woesearchaeota archaeon]|nr:TatD family hydrolase [Candidatus Woesearchaeota archaeon]